MPLLDLDQDGHLQPSSSVICVPDAAGTMWTTSNASHRLLRPEFRYVRSLNTQAVLRRPGNHPSPLGINEYIHLNAYGNGIQL